MWVAAPPRDRGGRIRSGRSPGGPRGGSAGSSSLPPFAARRADHGRDAGPDRAGQRRPRLHDRPQIGVVLQNFPPVGPPVAQLGFRNFLLLQRL